MNKIILISVLIIFAALAISCDVETNFTEDGHYGKAIIHNEAGSGKTITRITISLRDSNHFNDRVTVAPGKSSDEYKLWVSGWSLLSSVYRVTITLDDNTTKAQNISAYEDIVNNLYFNGTDLVER